MRWSGLFGCFAGLITTLTISTYLQLRHKETPRQISTSEEYVGRLEVAYDSFLSSLEETTHLPTQSMHIQKNIIEETQHEFNEINSNSVVITGEEAQHHDLGTTPAPTSTIVMVQPPKKTMVHPDQLHKARPLQFYDNNLPNWISRQIPCAGTGSQYCARGLDPAVPSPRLTENTELSRIPDAWTEELDARDISKSLQTATYSILTRSHIMKNSVCPPLWSSCQKSSLPSSSPKCAVDTVSHISKDHLRTSRDSNMVHASLKTQLLSLLKQPLADKKKIRVIYTVFTDRELDLIDELALTASRLGFLNPMTSHQAKGHTISDQSISEKDDKEYNQEHETHGYIDHSMEGRQQQEDLHFFVVAIGSDAVTASCEAGLATVAHPFQYATLSTARLTMAYLLTVEGVGLGERINDFWSFLPDVWFLRHPDQALPFKTSLQGVTRQDVISEGVDLVAGLSLLPDKSNKSLQNPSPDSGLFWCRPHSKLAVLFKHMASNADKRLTDRMKPFLQSGSVGYKNYELYGGVVGGEVDEASEIDFRCIVRSLKYGPSFQAEQHNQKQTNHQEKSWSSSPLPPAMTKTLSNIPPFCPEKPPIQNIAWGVFDPKLVLIDDMHPRTGGSQIVAVRVSGGGDPGGRAVVKHLGLWEGSNCFYCLGNISSATHIASDRDLGDNRKYIIYDGIVATNAEPVYHRIPMSIAVLSQLISLAFATDRILVLPAMIEMQKWTHAWEYLDTSMLNKLVSWRPPTFFDHLNARRYDELGWSADEVSASQMMFRGKSGVAVRRLSDNNIDQQEQPKWYRITDGAPKNVRHQEWAVARNSPQTKDATLLFVKFRRKTDSLIMQPCTTNPSVICRQTSSKRSSWLEYNIFTTLHWCHYRTRFAVKTNQKEPESKREWEHHDRNKDGAYIKPVDECSWPKRSAWPSLPKSLTSFSSGGKSLTGNSLRAVKDNKMTWVMASRHPCYQVAVSFMMKIISQKVNPLPPSNDGNFVPSSEGMKGFNQEMDALMKASWIQNEWVSSQVEIDLLNDPQHRDSKNDNGDKSDYSRAYLIEALALIQKKGFEATSDDGQCNNELRASLEEKARVLYLA